MVGELGKYGVKSGGHFGGFAVFRSKTGEFQADFSLNCRHSGYWD